MIGNVCRVDDALYIKSTTCLPYVSDISHNETMEMDTFNQTANMYLFPLVYELL